MVLPYCTIWRMGVVESTHHEGEPPPPSDPAQEAKMLADPVLCTSIPASALAGAGQEPPSAPAPGGGSPVKLKKKQPLGGGRFSVMRKWPCTKQFSVLTRQRAEVPCDTLSACVAITCSGKPALACLLILPTLDFQ